MKTALNLIFIFFFFACDRKATVPTEIQKTENVAVDSSALNDSGLPPPQYVTDPKEKKISSITDTLEHGDTLKIKFKTPHPKDFAITDPDGNFFYIVYSTYGTELPPLVDYDSFANLDTLNIITDRTKANPWIANVKEYRLIFTKAGNYRVMLSENLETDDGTPVEEETVYFKGIPRKK